MQHERCSQLSLVVNTTYLPWICLAVFAVSFLYSSVGQAGASGYIAVLAWFSVAPNTIKPMVLALTVLVACLGTFQFWRAGHFSWPLFWPLALISIPCSFGGGYVNLPPRLLSMVLGVLLLYAAVWLVVRPPAEATVHTPSYAVLLPLGGVLGWIAGLTGTGGGILLAPILILKRWAPVKTAAAVSAGFILTNAIAGLLGNITHTRQLPLIALPLSLAAVGGGALGSYLGSRRFSPLVVKRLLAVVLVSAGLKLLCA